MSENATEGAQFERARWQGPAMVLAALTGLALFVYFFRLGTPSWRGDEIIYRDAGAGYLSGDYSQNPDATFLAKYVLGAAQDVFGSGPVAVRAPTAVAGLLTGALLALLAARIGGWRAAALAFALWCLLPRPSVIGHVDVEQIKIERYARLDVYMGLFVAAAMLAAWRWAEGGRWRWALAAGAAVGLAAGSKQPGALILPAVIAVGLVTLGLSRRSLLQAAAIAGACALALLLTYLPAILAGEASTAIDAMRKQKDVIPLFGHPFVFEGTYYHVAPWWANAWWQWKSLGTAAAASVVACFALAPFVLRRGIAVLLVGATVTLAVVMSFWLGWSLPHYYYAWQPPLVLTCALVLYTLARRGGAARVAAAALAVPLVLAAVGTVRDVARLEPRDYAVVERELGDVLRTGSVAGEAAIELRAEVPGVRVVSDPVGVADLSAVIDDPTANRSKESAITAFLRRYRSRLALRKIDFLRVYLTRSRAAARRLAALSAAARTALPHTPAGRRAAGVKRCLERRGLDVALGRGSGGGVALIKPSSGTGVAMRVSLPSGSEVIIVADASPKAAARSAHDLVVLLHSVGGSAEQKGSLVVGYPTPPLASEASRVDACT